MKYENHPIADLFPLIDGKEFTDLVESLKTNGFQPEYPIIIYEGKILDGRNRDRASREANIQGVYKTPEIKDPFAFVAAANLTRRHLTMEVRAFIASEMANMKRGGDHFLQKQSTDRRIAQISRHQAAKIMNVSQTALDCARAVKTKGIPEIKHAVDNHEISLRPAHAIALLPVSSQPEALKLAISNGKNGKRAAAPKPAPDPKTIADNAQINEPSIFPVDAPLPVHKSGELNTKYIQEAITELRKNEPLLGKMSRATMNEDIWTYTQRIQTYGMNLERDGRVCGPIDQRFILWAGTVANKVRAREAILDRIGRAVERYHANAKANGSAPAAHVPKKGPAGRLHKLQHELKKLRTALRKIHFSQGDLPELKRIFDRFISDYFEDINPSSSNNGSKDPLQ